MFFGTRSSCHQPDRGCETSPAGGRPGAPSAPEAKGRHDLPWRRCAHPNTPLRKLTVGLWGTPAAGLCRTPADQHRVSAVLSLLYGVHAGGCCPACKHMGAMGSCCVPARGAADTACKRTPVPASALARHEAATQPAWHSQGALAITFAAHGARGLRPTDQPPHPLSPHSTVPASPRPAYNTARQQTCTHVYPRPLGH